MWKIHSSRLAQMVVCLTVLSAVMEGNSWCVTHRPAAGNIFFLRDKSKRYPQIFGTEFSRSSLNDTALCNNDNFLIVTNTTPVQILLTTKILSLSLQNLLQSMYWSSGEWAVAGGYKGVRSLGLSSLQTCKPARSTHQNQRRLEAASYEVLSETFQVTQCRY